MTTPTPEQLSEWTNAAQTVWDGQGRIHWVNMDGFDNYVAGYLRAKTDMLYMMKLARFGAEVLSTAVGFNAIDIGDVCVTAAKLDLLTDLGVIPPAIEATIEQLLKE